MTKNLLRIFVAACLSLIFIMALKANAQVDERKTCLSGAQAGDGGKMTAAGHVKSDFSFAFENNKIALSRELNSFLCRSRARWSKEDKEDVVQALLEIESKYGFRPRLFLKLMKIESNFKINAVSRDGARGLCQIQPQTARQISKRLGQPAIPEELLFDPVLNLKLSAEYLSYLEQKYKALPKAVRAYNMGPGAFSRIYGEGGIPKGRYNDLLAQ